jgi:hypothetical protein
MVEWWNYVLAGSGLFGFRNDVLKRSGKRQLGAGPKFTKFTYVRTINLK